MPIFKSLRNRSPSPYELRRLVDHRRLPLEPSSVSRSHIICDIDKTYLETEFESIIRMARIALEAASDKITVAGASEVLLAARWGVLTEFDHGRKTPRPLHFVSSSPPQLRAVLEEKMAIDGLDWTSDTFKNQAYNLRMRRLDLLRHHVAYKTLAIINIIHDSPEETRFYLIGDNAESDAFIYMGVKLYLDGRLDQEAYKSYLEISGVESSLSVNLSELLGQMSTVGSRKQVAAILIRQVPGYSTMILPTFTSGFIYFDDFFQAALGLAFVGLIDADSIMELARSFHNHYGLTLAAIRSSFAAVLSAPGCPSDLAKIARAGQTKFAERRGISSRNADIDDTGGRESSLGQLGCEEDSGLNDQVFSSSLRSIHSPSPLGSCPTPDLLCAARSWYKSALSSKLGLQK